MNPENSVGVAEPPEGVVTGDTVPRENEEDDRYTQAVDELVGVMKTHPAYSGRSESELREIAAEKIKQQTE